MVSWSFTPKTLRGQILLYSGVPIALVLAAVIAVFGEGMYRFLWRASEKDLRLNVTRAAQEIERRNQVVVSLAKTLALVQEGGMFGKRAETVQHLFKIVENNPELFDAYVIYEPDADGQDRLFRGQPGSEKNGRFNAAVDNLNGKLVLVNGIDMETSLYYQGVKDKFLSGSPEKYMITEPYLYEKTMMVEHTYPIVSGGKFVGIAGADRSLEAMADYLTGLKPYQSADFILVSRLGGVICATMDPKLNTRKVAQTPYVEILKPYHEGRGLETIRESVDAASGTNYLYAAAPIATGQWTLVMRVAEGEILQPIWDVLGRVVLISIVGLLLTVLILIFVSRSITRPIQTAVAAAERVASGDLGFEIQTGSSAEPGKLLSALRTMTGKLGGLIGQVQQSGIQMPPSPTELAASARELEATVAEQAAATDQVDAMAGDICRQAQELVQTVGEVAAVGSRTAGLAESGRSGLVRMETKMRSVAEATSGIAAGLAVIREKAGNITQVITTITKVADQTNLLSLNATIEAEKAGPLGRGFAVVAREVRRLADQTAVATLEIESMVQEMHGAVAAGVAGMDRFSQDVGICMDDIAGVVTQLEGIINQVQALHPRFEAVNAGMQSQADAARQISEITSQLSQSAQQIRASASEFNQVTRQLQDAARGLRDEVARFKLGH